MKTTEISVLISTYDDYALVEKKLAEILAQTEFDRAEFIFIEPASPGNERELLDPFCEEHPNCRLITCDKKKSLYEAWNIGWNAATTPFVCISNMDDVMHPQLIEKLLLEMNRGQWDLLSVLILKQSAEDPIHTWELDKCKSLDLSKRPGAFFVWKNSLKNTIGMFDESLTLVGDKDFWARGSAQKLKIGLIPKVLYIYAKHAEQLSRRGEFKEIKAKDREICKKKSYIHKWPSCYSRKVRCIRILSKLPFWGRRYVAKYKA